MLEWKWPPQEEWMQEQQKRYGNDNNDDDDYGDDDGDWARWMLSRLGIDWEAQPLRNLCTILFELYYPVPFGTQAIPEI